MIIKAKLTEENDKVTITNNEDDFKKGAAKYYVNLCESALEKIQDRKISLIDDFLIPSIESYTNTNFVLLTKTTDGEIFNFGEFLNITCHLSIAIRKNPEKLHDKALDGWRGLKRILAIAMYKKGV